MLDLPLLYLVPTAVASFTLGVAVTTTLLSRAERKQLDAEYQSRVLFSHTARLQAWLISDMSHEIMAHVDAGETPSVAAVDQVFQLVDGLQQLAPTPDVIHAVGTLRVKGSTVREGLYCSGLEASVDLRRDVGLLLSRLREQEAHPR